MGGQVVARVDFSPDYCIFLLSVPHRGIFPCTSLELFQRTEYYSVEVMAALGHILKEKQPISPQGEVCLHMLFLRDNSGAKLTEKK